MKLLCEHNPVPAEVKGTLRKMTDQDRAELGLPPLIENRGNRNTASESFAKDKLDAMLAAFDYIRIDPRDYFR